MSGREAFKIPQPLNALNSAPNPPGVPMNDRSMSSFANQLANASAGVAAGKKKPVFTAKAAGQDLDLPPPPAVQASPAVITDSLIMHEEISSV